MGKRARAGTGARTGPGRGGTAKHAAKATTKKSSKARLATMGKRGKTGAKGINAAYMTRGTILRRLQLTLKDFRRLCILKGVYPRDPPKTPQAGKDKVYYHARDVARLANEPLVNKFREFKALMVKVRRSANRAEVDKARRQHAAAPQYTLHHLVKQRYPAFKDALNDLDDALSLIALFACLPAAGRVAPERTESCKVLLQQWQNYVAATRCLTKAFVSVKGVYCRAEVEGVAITWLTPHAFTQHIPPKVDFRVMLTFLEFYECSLKFVLFKLYKGAGYAYPPARVERASAFVASVDVDEDAPAPLKGLTVALAREASYGWLEFVAAAAGAAVAAPGDAATTHIIADRPLKADRDPGKDYVQPQWVVDSLNKGAALNVAKYLPGRPPPPHLSPFVDYEDAVAEEAEAEAEPAAAVDEADAPLRDADADAEQSLEAKQAHEMAKTMMSKKARRLYDRMQHGKQRKAQAQQRLR
eukprot:CAMPEP_0119295684 /NCGR_PEP_ID=MMETSP1329-20130426/50187_1 /TAXON_ID=114041 /ORGANISM="Genus nov. species nov., Strain RCC1024" /LENGTH=471 /DNA_ID=CAMNT_0007296603 /DNA_START=206 /DNA_END=1617 /DNA_ORIENTATION=-